MATATMAAKRTKTRVLLVDDHPIVRQGLAQLINHEADLEVCAEAEDARKALDAIVEHKPDFVIVDISLRGIDGIDLIKTIRARDRRLPLLVVSMHDEFLYAERALRAGANGYIMKGQGTDEMIGAIRRVLKGRIYLSDAMGSRLLQGVVNSSAAAHASPLERLSDRELEIYSLIGEGMGSREIAAKLFLSVKTIESYCANIKDKLNLRSSREVLQHATQWVEREQNRTL
jgi:DNA-binding NarL/FixJ family response regulator